MKTMFLSLSLLSLTAGAASLEIHRPAAKTKVAAQAEQTFTGRCGICHGESGLGDGVAAMGMKPAPRSFFDAAWQKTVTDDYLQKVIAEGGAAHGKSPLMPAHTDLSQDVIKALVKLIRAQAKSGLLVDGKLIAPKIGGVTALTVEEGKTVVVVVDTNQNKKADKGEQKASVKIDKPNVRLQLK